MKKYFFIFSLLFFGFLFFHTAYAIPTCPPSCPPTVTTNGSTLLSSTSARLLGEVTFIDGAASGVVGFQYGLDTNYGNEVISQSGTFTLGTFDSTVTSLPC